MGWAIGFDDTWQRDIGYGVPAWCDFPDCPEKIDRGLSFVCGGGPYGGEEGCGLYFCPKHLKPTIPQQCKMCACNYPPYDPRPEHPDWLIFKLMDPSWAEWRMENEKLVKEYAEQLGISLIVIANILNNIEFEPK